MTYAISTFTDNALFFCGIGIIWGTIILFFDRFIVSNFKKSKSIAKDFFSFQFMLRFFLAVFIGIAVSHPLVLLLFRDSISEELEVFNAEKKDVIRRKYADKEKEVIRLDSLSLVKDHVELTEKNEDIKCIRKLMAFEQAGTKVELTCGASSGYLGASTRTTNFKALIDSLSIERDSIQMSIARVNLNTKKKTQELDTLREKEIRVVASKFGEDYLNKSICLERLSEKHSIFAITKWFMLLFILFMDTLPVLLKVVTKRGTYDRILSDVDEEDFEFDFYKDQRIGSKSTKRRMRKFVENLEKRLNHILYHELNDTFVAWKADPNRTVKDLLSKIKMLLSQLDVDFDPNGITSSGGVRGNWFEEQQSNIAIVGITAVSVVLGLIIFHSDFGLTIGLGAFVLTVMSTFKDRKSIFKIN